MAPELYRVLGETRLEDFDAAVGNDAAEEDK
jgi:hypothetical protein